ncbi:MAG: hypothetical protein CSA29_05615 [Desulfobacterales bacterium]|nr:MAG: hypothetical protein CSA29_05615 [Desulfobacterales bacterium]
MKKIVTLNEMIRRTKTEVEEIISPYIASEFLDDGTNREEWIDGWILDEDDDEEDFSVKGISVSILRAMSHKKKLGDFEIDEMPGYEAGNWCLVTFEENGMPGSFLTAFVEDSDGVVKWYGNRVPFYFESDIYSIHVLDRGDDREDKMS